MYRGFVFVLLFATAFPAAHADKKTLKYCFEGSPSSFYPAHASDGPSINSMISTVYDSLIRMEYRTGKLSPGLAEKWEISKDGKTYTFHLRKNVRFHPMGAFQPTKNFSSADVLFSLNRQIQENHPFHSVGGARYPYFQSQRFGELISEISAPDENTVVIRLKQPRNTFLGNISGYWAVIQSSEYAEYLQKSGRVQDMDLIPVGTGPYVFKEYAKDSLIRFEAFANYWQGKRKVESLILPIVTDASVRVQKLKTGECDVINMPPMNEVEALRKIQDIRVDETIGSNVAYMAYNTRRTEFQQLKVRQALDLALDRDKYIEAVYLGNAVPASGLLPQTYYGSKVARTVQNIEKAKKLLAEAGYPNGFKTNLWYPSIARPYLPNGKQLAVMVQNDLKKIGVEAELVTMEWATFWAKLQQGEHDLAIIGWNGLTANADTFFSPLLSCASAEGGTNYSRLCDPKLQDLVDFARTTTELNKIKATYQEAEKLVAAVRPMSMIANSKVFSAHHKRVRGAFADPTGLVTFYNLDIE